MALRLLSLEPYAASERLRNKEEVIMEWTLLWMIETVVALMGVCAIHFMWRE
jgi:hypothetical protein